MARVNVRVVGGATRQVIADNIQQIKDALGLQTYGAVINGQAAGDGYRLNDGETVVMSTNSKGGDGDGGGDGR